MVKSINTILIANRGEIASRIIRTCRKMGIKSVVVFSDADRKAPYVQEANSAIFIGENNPAASYLNQDKIIEAAKKTQADAIHPGYGFLSENAAFARRCAQEGILFIGPHPEAIEAMGSKSQAKEIMQKHGVATVPGYQGKNQDLTQLTKAAAKIGFPVLLKATAGGGGKGMRIVKEESALKAAIKAAKREALNAFGDDELIIEKYIASGRHIEFQVFGDKHGNILHLLERECTIQRRYQKVIEESPSPVMDENLRSRMGEAAVLAAKALNYDNAGTVEFIYDEYTKEFYFLEVNTRLQVEHSVTEAITGLDLVQLQIESAQGTPLTIQQTDIIGNGYAIECRLYAEDASNNFLPVTGTIHRFEVPEVDGLRIDTGIQSGSEVSIFYDPMIAKIIVWDQNRLAAHRKMRYVLQNMVCQGITTNQDFLLQLLAHPDFHLGQYDTHFIANKLNLSRLGKTSPEVKAFASMAACLFDWQGRAQSRTLLRSIPAGWRNNFYDYQKEIYLIDQEEFIVKYRYQDQVFLFLITDQEYLVSIISFETNYLRLEINGLQYSFNLSKDKHDFFVHNEIIGNVVLAQKDRFPPKEKEAIKGGYKTPMPAQIVKVLVKEGQQVSSGESLIVLSSMKMESTIEASTDGTVEVINVNEGQNVEAGFLLLKIKESEN